MALCKCALWTELSVVSLLNGLSIKFPLLLVSGTSPAPLHLFTFISASFGTNTGIKATRPNLLKLLSSVLSFLNALSVAVLTPLPTGFVAALTLALSPFARTPSSNFALSFPRRLSYTPPTPILHTSARILYLSSLVH